MTDAPQKRASIRLRIREKLSGISLIYAISMRKLAVELTGKANLDGLFAWCKAQGVGVDGFMLTHLPGGLQGEAWFDGRRQRGVFIDSIGNVAATLVDGKVKGDDRWTAWLAVLPATEPAEWGAKERAPAGSAAGGVAPKPTPAEPGAAKPGAPKPGAAKPAAAKPAAAKPKAAKPKAAKPAALVVAVDVELSSRAQAKTLSAVHRRQLEAASKELCGKKGLAALLAWCDDEGQGLAHVVVSAGKTPRYEGWLAASLEDGAFFDAGETKLCGLGISQMDVHASVTAREGEVAALQKAMSKLRAGRAPAWKG